MLLSFTQGNLSNITSLSCLPSRRKSPILVLHDSIATTKIQNSVCSSASERLTTQECRRAHMCALHPRNWPLMRQRGPESTPLYVMSAVGRSSSIDGSPGTVDGVVLYRSQAWMKFLISRSSASKLEGMERYVVPFALVAVKLRKRSMQARVVGPIACSSIRAVMPTGNREREAGKYRGFLRVVVEIDESAFFSPSSVIFRRVTVG